MRGDSLRIDPWGARLKKLSLEEVVIDGTRVRADSDRHGARTAEALERRLAALDVAKERDKVKKAKEGKKSPGVRVPVTDPDAHILPNKEGGYAPNYNPVIAVEPQSGLIIGECISKDNSESDCMVGLIQEIEYSFKTAPKRALADGNFGSGPELQALKEKGIETYSPKGQLAADNPARRERYDQPVPESEWERLPCSGKKLAKAAFVYNAEENAYYCPMGHALPAYRQQSRQGSDGQKVSITEYKGAPCQGCPLAARCLSRNARLRTISRDEYEPLREEVAMRMNTPEGAQIYAQRAPHTEGPFGTIKGAMGVRRFNRRGLQQIREDWTWTCLAYNLKKLMSWTDNDPNTTDPMEQQRPLNRLILHLRSALSAKFALFSQFLNLKSPIRL